jgi:[acyl-carrier-protein] S-malonyltransferase
MILHKVGFRSFTKSSHLRCSNKIKDLLDNAASGLDASPQNEDDKWSTSPYPEGAVFSGRNRDQSKKVRRSGKDPKYTSIMMFPGQGAQKVGMGRNLLNIPEAMDMYKTASEILG